MSIDNTREAICALLVLKAAELDPTLAEKFPLAIAEAKEAVSSFGYDIAWSRERLLAPTQTEKPDA